MGKFNPYGLAGLTYLIAKRLGETWEGTATGGTTSTLIDTRFLVQANDFWGGDGENMGTCWILTDVVAQCGDQVSRITDFVSSTSTLTLADSLAVAPEALALYAVAGPRFPLMRMIGALNAAIYDMGKIVYTRTADYTTATQTEYALVAQADDGDIPVLIDADAEVREVWVQGNTGNSDDNEWHKLSGWYVQKGNISAMGRLILPFELVTGRALKIVYYGQHPFLFQYGARFYTELDEGLPYQLVVNRAALRLLEEEMAHDVTHPNTKMMHELLMRDAQDLETRFKKLNPFPTPRKLIVPSMDRYFAWRRYPDMDNNG